MLMDMSWAHSREAEQSVLGGLLLDNAALDHVADIIRAEDFYADSHRRIFRAAASMIEAGRSADILTVGEFLQRDHLAAFESMGGHAYLGSLAQNTPSALNIRRYAELVKDRSLARRLFHAANETTTAVLNRGGREVRQLVDDAQQRILAVGEISGAGRDFAELSSVMSRVFEFVDERYHREGDEVTGVPTGFRDLDIQTTGMQPGELIVLAARPAMGKSALALNIAEYAARAKGKPGLLFNLEMSNQQTGLRLLAAAAGVNVQRLVTGRLNDVEWGRLSAGMGKLHDVPLLFNEDAGLSVSDMRALSRRAFRANGGLSLIVVDYLQLMLSGESDSNRANEVAMITRGLKLLAKELQVPVLALSQLSRKCEERSNKRPVMSDLRDSGAIEQDADIILFVYRDEYYNVNTPDKHIAEIIVSKQRNGPIGTVRLRFRSDMTRFENEHDYPEARAA